MYCVNRALTSTSCGNVVYCFPINPLCFHATHMTNVWHKRLAHPLRTIINRLCQQNELEHCTNVNKSHYFLCPWAKSHKLPFKTYHIKATHAFDLVNMIYGYNQLFPQLVEVLFTDSR